MMSVKHKPILKFIETKTGFNICNKFGNPFLHVDEQVEKELWDYLIKKREKRFKKTHPLRHKMVTEFSEMGNSHIRITMKTAREEFSGIIQRTTKK